MILKSLVVWLVWSLGDLRSVTVEPYNTLSYLNDTNFADCSATTTTGPTTTDTSPLPPTSTSTPFTTSKTDSPSSSSSTTSPPTSTSTTTMTSSSPSPTSMTPVVSSSPSPTTEHSTTGTTTSTGTISLEASTGQPSSPSTVVTSTTTSASTTTGSPTTIATETSTTTMDSTALSTLSSSTSTTSSPTPSTTPGSTASPTSLSALPSNTTTVPSAPPNSTTVTPTSSPTPLPSSTPSTPSSTSSSPTVPSSSPTTTTVGSSPSTSTKKSTSVPSGIETTTSSSSSMSPTTSLTSPTTTTSQGMTSSVTEGSSSSVAQEKATSTTTSTRSSTATTEAETTETRSFATKTASTTGVEGSSTVTTTTESTTTTGSPSTLSQSTQTSTSASSSSSLPSTVPSTSSTTPPTSSEAVEITPTVAMTDQTTSSSTEPSSSPPSTPRNNSSSTAGEMSTVGGIGKETDFPASTSSNEPSSASSSTSEALVSSSEPATTGSTPFGTSPKADSTVTVTESSTTSMASSTSADETTTSSISSSTDLETTGPATPGAEETTGTEAFSATTLEAETTTVVETSSHGFSTVPTTTEMETSVSETSSAAATALSAKITPQPGPSPSSVSTEIPSTRLTEPTSTSTTTGAESLGTTSPPSSPSSRPTPLQVNVGRNGPTKETEPTATTINEGESVETTSSGSQSSPPPTPAQGNGGKGHTTSPTTKQSATSEPTSTENPMETSQKEVEATTSAVMSSDKTTTTTTEGLLVAGGNKITFASTTEKASTAPASAGETTPDETSSTSPSTLPSSTLMSTGFSSSPKSSSSTAALPTPATKATETDSTTIFSTETAASALNVTSEKTTAGSETSPTSSSTSHGRTGATETTTLPTTSTTEGKAISEKITGLETSSSPSTAPTSITETSGRAGTTAAPTRSTTERSTTAPTTRTTSGTETSTSGKGHTTSAETTPHTLEVTSLPFSTMTDSPTTAFKPETSQAASTQPKKTTATPASPTTSGTSTARPTSRQTTQPPKPTPKLYGEGCPQRCPEGSLVGTECCYTIVPLPFRKTFQGSFTYCQRNRTGHLIEAAEVMLDSDILKPWVKSMDYENATVYINQIPFFQIGSRSYGQVANLSSITQFLISPQPVIFLEEVYYTGICKIPQFCGTFNCSMVPLYDSLPGLLPLPMLEDVAPGANVTIQCNSPSITALKLKCDSFGKFFPRPGTPGASCKVSHRFNREKNTPGNKPLRPFCDCNFRGTASCVPVGDEFLCVCKPGWLKNTCWKSPDICWTPIGAPNKCLDRGTCFSWTDEFSCSCDYGFGGEICQIVLSNITWFGTPTTTAFLTPGRIMAISMLSVDFLEMFGRALLKYFPTNSRVPQDPLGFVHTWRKFSVGVAGFVGVFYAHPGWFDIGGDCCRMVYVCINGLMLFGHWMVFMESFVVFSVYFGLGRNRWSLAVEQTDPENWFQPQEAQKRWYLTKGFVFYIGAEICAFIQLFLLDRFYSHMIAPHSCIGQIISLENPITIVNLQIMGALACAASGLGILTQLVKLAYPELLAEQRGFYEFHKGRQGVELLDKVVRNNFQQMFQGPVLFAGYFIVVWSQDAVAFSSDQSLVGMAAVPVTICSVLLAVCNLIAYSPWVYGHLMKFLLPRARWLPIWTTYTPNSHGYLSHEEIVNRKEPNVTLEVNEDWPVRPEEDEYVSAERRHQCERRLTRNYLEMRLQGLTKDVCLEMIAERFLLAIPEGDMEGPQWLLILDRWLKTIERLDNIRWNIPRTQAETNDIYFDRVMSATLFCEADILRENKDWARMEHLYYLMGHYPLEQNYLPRTWPQCRHVSQHKKLEEEWMAIRFGGDKTCRRRTKKNAAKLSPELFASPEAIQKYRKHAKEPHTELREFPGARRYLLNDFYDKVFYGMEEGKRRWGVGMRQGGVVEITDYMIDRAKDIQREDLRRRITPKTMNAYSRPEWMGEEDLIRMSVPKASVLIGMNEKLKEVVSIPPVILDRMGVPSSLYRW